MSNLKPLADAEARLADAIMRWERALRAKPPETDVGIDACKRPETGTLDDTDRLFQIASMGAMHGRKLLIVPMDALVAFADNTLPPTYTVRIVDGPNGLCLRLV